jgi:hypothetical protein
MVFRTAVVVGRRAGQATAVVVGRRPGLVTAVVVEQPNDCANDHGNVLHGMLVAQPKVDAGARGQAEHFEHAGAFGKATAGGRQAARRRPEQPHPSAAGQRPSQVSCAEHLVVVVGEHEEPEPCRRHRSRHRPCSVPARQVGMER